MRKALPQMVEDSRVVGGGSYASEPGKLYGAFLIERPGQRTLKILSSGTDHRFGWEHVSVSTQTGPPSWDEMCFVKDLFWSEKECVMQLHPPKADYVNNHPYVLHLWRPLRATIPRPKKVQV